jgi:hypothetical protein
MFGKVKNFYYLIMMINIRNNTKFRKVTLNK